MIDEKKMAAQVMAQQKEGSGQWVGRLVSWDGCCGRWVVAHVEHAGGTEWLHLDRTHPKLGVVEYVVAPARQCHAVTGASEQEAAAVTGEGPQAEGAPAHTRGSSLGTVGEAIGRAAAIARRREEAQAMERITQDKEELRPVGPGDVVRLKSSGPWMTVSAPADEARRDGAGRTTVREGWLTCRWFHLGLVLMERAFPAAALERRPAEDPRQAGG